MDNPQDLVLVNDHSFSRVLCREREYDYEYVFEGGRRRACVRKYPSMHSGIAFFIKAVLRNRSGDTARLGTL